MAACPYCRNTGRYTDPNLQVRCIQCFNVLNDQAPGTPIGTFIDTEAPMTVGNHTYYGVREGRYP